MPEVKSISQAKVIFLYTDIGRGHPGYMNGIIEIVDRNRSETPYWKANVFSLSTGASLFAWKLVRFLYVWGAKGGLISALYSLLRRFAGSGDGGLLLRLLGRGIRRQLSGFAGPVIVAHPILARMLAGDHRVIYQHGELAAPSEAMVLGCLKILVPLKETADVFSGAGIAEDIMVITGQCIEPDLLAGASQAFEQRLQRMRGNGPLTAALFSSGAYPPPHLCRLKWTALSLYHEGYNVYIFAGMSSKIAGMIKDFLTSRGVPVGAKFESGGFVKIIRSEDRQDENKKFASVFDEIDFFVAPAHERTNWSIGLGLPQLIVKPPIGSYAPLNAAIALDRGTAFEIGTIAQAKGIGKEIASLREQGKLEIMARNGYGADINGFERSAQTIVELTARSV